MGKRRFASPEIAALRRGRAALRQVTSRRDALAWLAATGAPLAACAGHGVNDLMPSSDREPYEFPPAGGRNSADESPQICLEAQGACTETADNILGPFYKQGAPFRNDLTSGVRVSKVLEVRGRVLACDCETPLSGALIDVWQADEDGVYDNTGYLLRARLQTDADGQYQYSSVLPGAYLNGDQYRPRHIHCKVSHPSATPLVTQLYFQGDPYISQDPFVKDASVVPLSEDSGIYRVTFDIVLV
jgi:protocatechuate 3,4-dioxygenase beta subunit